LTLPCSLVFTACSPSTHTIERPANYTKLAPGADNAFTNSAVTDETEVAAAQNNRASHVQVTCTLPVKRMLRPDDKGEKHEKFLLQLSNGSTILVAHNVSRAPSVPVEAGDIVTVHGEYIWNNKGGVIHWTHASDTPRHAGGYIDFKGRRYQ
jgi:hypothetical protein